ncbi:tRNA (adenosine(37)-N6)-threonylcarbamoyltransferase complex dimerization subunit type 1 TsaB [Aureimonas populi]|uniref:tRNA (Adenosine(37)-N6)-threonylcarbamoyltransferase complex dimerization subunit type 1 TsaB n=1 Tax=Aureimonas populi TaxID=1701758 RepID=A0ABW5CSL5_9HYPH|nr:tRNA (adenosine(37)-N6)-threonylcarbamoyltransferase complex dimerization subunit type 1 TsaB [Aureimonas populi]
MSESLQDPARRFGGLLLALDTAGARCSAAVFDASAGAVLASAEPEIGRGHAEALMDVIAGVLSDAGIGYGDLSRVAVTVGPGSFTGIRVGVSTARALALALGIPAVGVSVLEALAGPHRGGAAPVLAVQDARRGEVYAALYAQGGETLREARALAPEALADFGLAAVPILVGSGAALAAPFSPGAVLASEDGLVSIGAVARIGARIVPGAPVVPLYLRGPDAKPQVSSGLRATAPFQSAADLP